MLLQQKSGQVAPLLRNESQRSEKMFYEQIGSITAEQVTSRFAESPVNNTPHDRRMVTLTPFAVGDFIDTFERVQTLIDPSSAYVQNFVRALGREKDRVAFQAFFATAYTGKEGTTTEAYNTTVSTTAGGQVVEADFNTANSGLLIEKLIEARRTLLSLHWDPAVMAHIIINSGGLSDLLNQVEIQSSDYNSIKALVRGEVNTYMGFNFSPWEGYVLNGTNVMRGTGVDGGEVVDCFPVFQRDSVLVATGIDVQTEVTRRADRSFHYYAYARAMFGATRMEATRVLKIERYISG
jgi:hypothetical protein